MVTRVKVKDVFETWSYFLIDEETKHGFLIDPGAEAKKLLAIIAANGWTIERILLTHGHFDHTGAVRELSEALGVPYAIHVNGRKYLESTHFNLSRYCERDVILSDAETFTDGDSIALRVNPAFALRVLHTPGHTEDSCLFYVPRERLAFVGDTIFLGSLANTSYPGGNQNELWNSLLAKVFRLPPDTILYSGHSEPTRVGTELKRYL